MAKMKAARWHNRNDVRVEELEIPQPKANQIKIEVSVEVICMNIWEDLFLFR